MVQATATATAEKDRLDAEKVCTQTQFFGGMQASLLKQASLKRKRAEEKTAAKTASVEAAIAAAAAAQAVAEAAVLAANAAAAAVASSAVDSDETVSDVSDEVYL